MRGRWFLHLNQMTHKGLYLSIMWQKHRLLERKQYCSCSMYAQFWQTAKLIAIENTQTVEQEEYGIRWVSILMMYTEGSTNDLIHNCRLRRCNATRLHSPSNWRDWLKRGRRHLILCRKMPLCIRSQQGSLITPTQKFSAVHTWQTVWKLASTVCLKNLATSPVCFRWKLQILFNTQKHWWTFSL